MVGNEKFDGLKPGEGHAMAAVSRAALDFSPVRALVVDGNTPMRRVVGDMLRAFGLGQVNEAASVPRALLDLAVRPVDIILLELLLETSMDEGIDLIRRLRAQTGHRQRCVPIIVPIIVLSGHAEPLAVARARDAGASDFLAKPMSAATLYQRLAAALSQQRRFIQAPAFFGPDRRRRSDPHYRGTDRRFVRPQQVSV